MLEEETTAKKTRYNCPLDETEIELQDNRLSETTPANIGDIDMMSNNQAPQEQPPWMIGFEDRIASKTAKLMDARISGIETHAQQTRADMATMQKQLALQGSAQMELKAQVAGMQEALRKADDDQRDDRSRSTADTTNPYSNPKVAVDKALIIVGGWPDNSAAPVMIANLKEVLVAYNRDNGKHWAFEDVRCLGQRGKIVQAKIQSVTDRTSLQQGYDFCKWIRAQVPKQQAVGFRGESSNLWAVMNQPVETRNLSKTINRVVHCLHQLREKKGISETVLEQGYPLKLIEGKYRGRTIGAQINGVFVAVVNETTHAVTWDMPKVAQSVLACSEQEITSMMASLTPTTGE